MSKDACRTTEVRYSLSSRRSTPGTGARPWFGAVLDPRNNSLNLIRLILALAVLVHHSWPLAGVPDEPKFAGDTLGGWAVAGFFGISGYLITSSRWSNRLGDYLVHRVARIMPAFLICLLTLVVVFAPIGYVVAHGNLQGYLSTEHSPLNFLISNAGLKVNFYDIAATPANVPYPGAWNGSLWSLYYEFVCYLIIAGLGALAFVRKSPWPLTAGFVLSVLAQANIEGINRLTNGNFDVVLLLRLLPFFLGGATVFIWKEKVGIHWIPGVASLAGAFVLSSTVPLWGGQASGVLVAYGVIWLSTVVSQPRLIARNDISYGVYIYAFAVQQLLAVFGAHVWGLWWFTLAATVITIPLAVASWLLVERPVMRRVRGRKEGHAKPALPAAAAEQVPAAKSVLIGAAE